MLKSTYAAEKNNFTTRNMFDHIKDPYRMIFIHQQMVLLTVRALEQLLVRVGLKAAVQNSLLTLETTVEKTMSPSFLVAAYITPYLLCNTLHLSSLILFECMSEF